MVLYHGSNLEVSTPKLHNQSRGLDFGAGFYMTLSKQQADNFAQIVINRKQSGVPTVNVFELNEQKAARELSVLNFAEANAEWLEFVKANRFKTYRGTQYDIIIGPVANDRVYPTLQAFISGQLSLEAALVELKTRKLFDQHCFATEAALATLRFVKAYNPQERE